jgi:hypothetical protein
MDLAVGSARLLGAALMCCLAVAIVLVWRIGPVVFTATPEHGLHLGDLLALPALAAAAHNVRPAFLRFVPISPR